MGAARRQLAKLEMVDLVLLAYWVIVSCVHLLFRHRVAAPGCRVLFGLLLLDAAMIGAILFTAHLSRNMVTERRLTLKSTLIFLTALLGFMGMEFYVHSVNPCDMEEVLIRFDDLLFGQPVAQVLEPYTIGIVTDFCQLCYVTHYLYPFALFAVLLHVRKFEEASHLMGIVAAVYLTSYLGYILFPARSPCVIAALPSTAHLMHFDGPIPFGPVAQAVNQWVHEAEAFRRDCFPSGHTEQAVVMLVAAWRFHRKTFLPYVVLLSGLVAGTLYLRYHYVIDLAAGALLGWLIVSLMPRLNARWIRYRKKLSINGEEPGGR